MMSKAWRDPASPGWDAGEASGLGKASIHRHWAGPAQLVSHAHPRIAPPGSPHAGHRSLGSHQPPPPRLVPGDWESPRVES